MSNDNLNGHNVGIGEGLTGDPNVIRVVQHFLRLAESGEICGAVVIGLTPQGNVHHSFSVPQVGAALTLAIGALNVMQGDLADNLKALRTKSAVSPIIKPASALHR